MRWRAYLCAPFLLLVLLPCCGSLVWSEPLPLGEEDKASKNANLAVSIEGHITVKRKGWTSYAPVVFGTYLWPGDLLRIDETSRVKILCSDLVLHELSAGVVGVPCERSRPVLQRPEGRINATRKPLDDGSFPRILSPRKTRLLSEKPLLRWTPVAGITTYQVIVRGVDAGWAKQVGSSTEIAYPLQAPRLRPGIDYKLIVEAGNRSSEEEPGLGLGFSILSQPDREIVQREEKQVDNLGLTASPTQFLIAHLYASHGLKADAIDKLESISDTFKVAAVEELLGDLYASIGLARQAEARYLKEVQLAESEKDEIGLMLTHLALARIYERLLGNKQAAIQHFEHALALANKLGDDCTVDQASKKLAELRKMAAPYVSTHKSNCLDFGPY